MLLRLNLQFIGLNILMGVQYFLTYCYYDYSRWVYECSCVCPSSNFAVITRIRALISCSNECFCVCIFCSIENCNVLSFGSEGKWFSFTSCEW